MSQRNQGLWRGTSSGNLVRSPGETSEAQSRLSDSRLTPSTNSAILEEGDEDPAYGSGGDQSGRGGRADAGSNMQNILSSFIVEHGIPDPENMADDEEDNRHQHDFASAPPPRQNPSTLPHQPMPLLRWEQAMDHAQQQRRQMAQQRPLTARALQELAQQEHGMAQAQQQLWREHEQVVQRQLLGYTERMAFASREPQRRGDSQVEAPKRRD